MFRDSDQEVEIQWYRAAPDAPTLGFPSSILSLDWLDDGYDEPWLNPIGEVWDTPRPYHFHGAPVGLTYDHVCGSEEDFQVGAVFDPHADIEYDDQGLPLCCEGPATPLMGVVVGMEVEVDEDIPPGTSCTEAPLVGVGEVMFTENDDPGFPLVWWRVAATTGQTIRFKSLLGAVPPNDALETLSGTTCSDPMFFTSNSIIDPTTRDVTIIALGCTMLFIRLTEGLPPGPRRFFIESIT